MVKVSFLTPVYNGAKFLRTCVDSVLRQTHNNWEYIIVNNCSSDNTLEIAKEYAARDPRIHVYSNERFVTADENRFTFAQPPTPCEYVYSRHVRLKLPTLSNPVVVVLATSERHAPPHKR